MSRSNDTGVDDAALPVALDRALRDGRHVGFCVIEVVVDTAGVPRD